MTDIRQLIADIRAWQAAREAHANNDGERGGTWHAVQYAAKAVTGSYLGSDELLPAFTTLAAHIRTLEAENARLRARVDAALAIDEWNTEASLGYQTDFANGACMMRETIRKALTGESEG
jgi:hypothetical protein